MYVCNKYLIFENVRMFDDILLFVEVVNSESFYHLAKKLSVAQSTISRRISHLENKLKARLINRDSRHFQLTEQGRTLYELFKTSATEWGSKLNAIYSTYDTIAGSLKVLLPPSFATYAISPYLGDFLREYPNIHLKLIYQYSQVDLYKENFDIAITAFLPQQNSINLKPIYKHKIIFVVSLKYKEKYGTPTEISQILNHLCIGGINETGVSSKQISIFNEQTNEKTIIEHGNLRLFMNNSDQVMPMVYKGEAIGGVPRDKVFNELASGELIQILPEYYAGVETIYMSWTINKKDLRFKAFTKFIDNCIKKLYYHSMVNHFEDMSNL